MISKKVTHVIDPIKICSVARMGWVQAVCLDFKWIATALGNNPLEVGSVHTIIASVTIEYAKVRKGLRAACKSKFALLNGSDDSPGAKPLGGDFDCSVCGIKFGSGQQLALHLFKTHSVTNLIRTYVNNTFCTVCL